MDIDYCLSIEVYLVALNKPIFREWPCAEIRLRYTLYSMHQAILCPEVVFQSRLQFFHRPVARVASISFGPE